jgi:hypothetical protein
VIFSRARSMFPRSRAPARFPGASACRDSRPTEVGLCTHLDRQPAPRLGAMYAQTPTRPSYARTSVFLRRRPRRKSDGARSPARSAS